MKCSNGPLRSFLLIQISFFAFVFFPIHSFADYYNSQYGYSGYYRGAGVSSAPVLSMNLDPQARLNTCFRIAAREDRIPDMEKYLKEGAEINGQSEEGITALIYAARNCSLPVVSFLLSRHAKTNVIDSHGRTALLYALREGCEHVSRILLSQSDIDFKIRDHDEKTAVDYASSSPILTEMLEQRLKMHRHVKVSRLQRVP